MYEEAERSVVTYRPQGEISLEGFAAIYGLEKTGHTFVNLGIFIS